MPDRVVGAPWGFVEDILLYEICMFPNGSPIDWQEIQIVWFHILGSLLYNQSPGNLYAIIWFCKQLAEGPMADPLHQAQDRGQHKPGP